MSEYTSRNAGIMRLPRIPEGHVLAHNHIMHTVFMPRGLNGFRWWTWPKEKKPRNFIRCKCGWSGLPHYAIREHVHHGTPAFKDFVELGRAMMKMPGGKRLGRAMIKLGKGA